MVCNWLSVPPDRLVFSEPFFLRPANSRLLRIQLDQWSMGVTDEEWEERPSEDARARFERLLAPRLAGRRWGLKEVVAEEHRKVLDELKPAKLVICVRDIVDVALSFFEKHRAQNNLDRFSDEWVSAYCLRESRALARLREEAGADGLPTYVLRYEDFTISEGSRRELERFLGWPGGGNVAAGLAQFGRAFELERHGSSISNDARGRAEREVPAALRLEAELLGEQCAAYQKIFGYAAG